MEVYRSDDNALAVNDVIVVGGFIGGGMCSASAPQSTGGELIVLADSDDDAYTEAGYPNTLKATDAEDVSATVECSAHQAGLSAFVVAAVGVAVAAGSFYQLH